MSKPQWFAESVIRPMRVSYKASRVLAELKTAYQQVVILENETFGRVLMLDGAVQTTTHDEFIYHEMLAHVPLFTHGSARDVLIIGGGDCGLAEEVLKHRTLQTVTQVEIDPDVVERLATHPRSNAAAHASAARQAPTPPAIAPAPALPGAKPAARKE